MILTEELIAFIRDHRNDNLDRLLLSASKYPGIQISGDRHGLCRGPNYRPREDS